MDINSVISYGHSAKQPLMCPASDHPDGLEPHDTIWSSVSRVTVDHVAAWQGEVYPGWCRQVGTGRVCIPGTTQPSRLRLISKILRLNRFILPFD